MIKHVTFDLWDTLIRRNPSFSEARVKCISEFLRKEGRRHTKDTDIKQALGDVSVFNTQVSMITGEHSLRKADMYALVLEKLGVIMTYERMGNKLLEMVDTIDQLFENYLPLFVHEDTLSIIDNVVSSGRTVSLVSNTGYIGGNDIHNYLVYSGLCKYFDSTNCYFSDITGLAKPNPQLFKVVAKAANLKPKEILHVGDNKIADGGCVSVGYNFYHVTIMHEVGNATTLDGVVKKLK